MIAQKTVGLEPGALFEKELFFISVGDFVSDPSGAARSERGATHEH